MPDAAGEAYRAFLHAFLEALKPELKKLGIEKETYFHVSDEPSMEQIDSYRAAKEAVAEDLKGYGMFDALSDYGFYEQGKRTPTIEVLLSLSKYYKVSLDWLISGSDNFGDKIVISDDSEKFFIEKYRKLNNLDKIKIEGMVDLKLVESSENHC